MNIRLRWIIPAFIILFLFLLLARAPANLLAGQLAQQFPLLSLSGVEGSFWSGRASRVQYDRIDAGELNWSFNPLDLLFASWGNAVELSNAGQFELDGDLSLSPFGSASLSNLHLQTRLAWLLEMSGKHLPGLVLDAEVDALIDDASWSEEQGVKTLEGSVRLTNLTLQPQNLGDFVAEVSINEAGQTLVEFQPLGETGLDASGTLEIGKDGEATLDMTLARLEALGNNAGLVKSLTRAQGERRHFSWQGNINTFLR
ncbi:type II secretion system protein N [Solemya velum gill symbiont]|uniref:Type II secretion system protein N n=1 Tax=Solemya velum gill symbiont TaxID=2340 RepID=A0A1T2CTY6_SOVGS|nr:type II secretion system protein N [Solemya velum gill symbiont]OOY35678.1 hypothetical protein BOV88_03280 [Solemya velum gill symbiont]OOY38306.1 hypothetical protein BOV89_02545 [Solemya velum gill symbiont]OOY40777.1 hypothetical protein BOV90_02310 [Solemya velum gill symbiont]OOY43534.1 hypothetical protein BOV92_10985 [Solemya velum gill symbiont]OOY43737.1 hypothetical protein BOV91_03195 [Solemya velum gill symbiont]